MNLQIKLTGAVETQGYLKEIARDYKKVVLDAMAKYIVGNESHGLKHSPYYKYINRQAGFPETGFWSKNGWVPGWHSLKQMRYVMAKIKSGEIKPGQDNRTGKLAESWDYSTRTQSGSWGGQQMKIWNTAPYAKWLFGDITQTRMHKLIGWRTISQVISTNMAGALNAAKEAVARWLKR